jgi:hypothetical protein
VDKVAAFLDRDPQGYTYTAKLDAGATRIENDRELEDRVRAHLRGEARAEARSQTFDKNSGEDQNAQAAGDGGDDVMLDESGEGAIHSQTAHDGSQEQQERYAAAVEQEKQIMSIVRPAKIGSKADRGLRPSKSTKHHASGALLVDMIQVTSVTEFVEKYIWKLSPEKQDKYPDWKDADNKSARRLVLHAMSNAIAFWGDKDLCQCATVVGQALLGNGVMSTMAALANDEQGLYGGWKLVVMAAVEMEYMGQVCMHAMLVCTSPRARHGRDTQICGTIHHYVVIVDVLNVQ